MNYLKCMMDIFAKIRDKYEFYLFSSYLSYLRWLC